MPVPVTARRMHEHSRAPHEHGPIGHEQFVWLAQRRGAHRRVGARCPMLAVIDGRRLLPLLPLLPLPLPSAGRRQQVPCRQHIVVPSLPSSTWTVVVVVVWRPLSQQPPPKRAHAPSRVARRLAAGCCRPVWLRTLYRVHRVSDPVCVRVCVSRSAPLSAPKRVNRVRFSVRSNRGLSFVTA